MGFASGFQVGASAVERGLKMREEQALKEQLAQAYAKPETSQGYTAQDGQQLEALAKTGAYDIVPQYAPPAEGQTQGLFTGYQAVPKAGLDLQGDMPAAPQAFNPQQVQDYGGQRIAGQFDPTRLQGLQAREAARVVGASGDFRGAAALQEQAARIEREAEEAPLRRKGLEQQIELGGIQLGTARRAGEREVGFDTAFEKINNTEYKTPAERDAAVLATVERFKGPEAKAQLQANYSTVERNNIANEGAKFDQTIKQARLKGPAAALQAIDDLNDSFKLEIDGFKVTQVNKDGSRVPFLEAKTPDEFAVLVDSRIKDGGAFELAKFRQDEKSKDALIGYYQAKTKEARAASGAAANQLSGVQVGYSRDPQTGQPIQVMSGLRFNKQTGALESVQVKLDQNVVPPSALDPKKIADQAEALVNTPVDPTNKNKDAPQHTFATAQQAVVDQIFNQYLGTGKPAGGLDFSAASVAQRMLAGNAPAAAAPTPPATVGLSPSQTRAGAATTARDTRFAETEQANREAAVLRQRAEADPDIRALRIKLADNMRGGDPRNTARLNNELLAIRKERYGF
jgi:hypothetical protein